MRARSAVAVGLILSLLVMLPVALASPAQAASSVCSANTPAAQRPVLKRGAKGSCVEVLQRLLTARGFAVTADGSFGPATDRAVRRFQGDRVELSVDAVVGARSWLALENNSGTRYSITRGPNLTSRVVLTYDDCPTSLAAFTTMVRAARDQGVALVLFPTGQCVAQRRVDVAYARSLGHYVFNHSNSHPDLTTLSAAGVSAQLSPPGVQGSYGRPPYGANNQTVRDAYLARGMRPWTWTVDTNDWRGPKSQAAVVSIAQDAPAGATVLMHMQHAAFNPTALQQIVSGLSARGIGVCRNSGGTAPANPTVLAC